MLPIQHFLIEVVKEIRVLGEIFIGQDPIYLIGSRHRPVDLVESLIKLSTETIIVLETVALLRVGFMDEPTDQILIVADLKGNFVPRVLKNHSKFH